MLFVEKQMYFYCLYIWANSLWNRDDWSHHKIRVENGRSVFQFRRIYDRFKAHDQISHMADTSHLRSIGHGLIPHMTDAQADIHHMKDKAYCPIPHIAAKPPCVSLTMTETCHVSDKPWPYDSMYHQAYNIYMATVRWFYSQYHTGDQNCWLRIM